VAYAALDFRGAGEAALELTRSGNKYIDDMAPWTLFKVLFIWQSTFLISLYFAMKKFI